MLSSAFLAPTAITASAGPSGLNTKNFAGYLGLNLGTPFRRSAANGTNDFLSTPGTPTGQVGFFGTNTVTGAFPGNGSYNVALTLTNVAGSLLVNESIATADGTTFSNTGSGTDANPVPASLSFNTVGLGFSGGLSADIATFSNTDVTLTPVPEPASLGLLGLLGLGGLVLLRRRR